MLVVFTQAPYTGSLARSGLDLALAAAAFEQPLSVLFIGEGVLQLLPEQDTTKLGIRNMAKTLASMPLYGVETLYVDAHSLDTLGIAKTCLPDYCETLAPSAVRELLSNHDHVVGL